MVTEPERYIRDFVECGADSITVHAEACEDLERTIEQIREAGVKVGVSIKPATPVNDISHMLSDVDMVLIMMYSRDLAVRSIWKNVRKRSGKYVN